jgi:hypothetical protein
VRADGEADLEYEGPRDCRVRWEKA